jgi:anti-sigma regulatory factor (Ser/Thr protein kinase)
MVLSLAWPSSGLPPDWVRVGLCPVCRTSVLVDDDFVRVRGEPRHSECARYVRTPRAARIIRLGGGSTAALEARAAFAAWGVLLDPAVRAQAELLLTELVTNAVRHGGAHSGAIIAVGFQLSTQRLRIAVRDPGPGFEWRPRRASRPPAEGGYGLLLVDEIARRWGVERVDGRTVVWAEIAEPGASGVLFL